MSTASERWRERLQAWAIPQALIDAAPESPYGFPAELFRQRAVLAIAETPRATTLRALEILPEDGSVLDVGVGGGATSLPLAARAARIVGVDAQADMLDAFGTDARARGLDVVTVQGRWPDVAGEAPAADVVVCGHVAYNVADLAPFVRALDAHAARRVVLELTAEHPMAWMNDLWLRFHAVARPDGPTADDAVAVLKEVGIAAHRTDEQHAGDPAGGGFLRREDAVALMRRRLCLSQDRDDDVATALGDRLRQHAGLWSAGPPTRTTVTLWWDARP